MKILVTGFDPFGHDRINPAIEAVRRLPDTIGEADLVKLMVPTSFAGSTQAIAAALLREHPDAVLNVGQAGGRFGLTPERIAINLVDARIPDNDGDQPRDQAIVPGGPAAYFTQLPVTKMVAAIQAAGLPAAESLSAGTFVCNHLMYTVQHLRATLYPELFAGFIHIPFLPSQVVARPNTPAMALDDSVRGLTAAIAAMI